MTMTDVFNPFYIFEHPEFADAFDCQRQSRLYGFRVQPDHGKYRLLSAKLTQQVDAGLLASTLEVPLAKVPDNTQLYILRINQQGRDTWLPVLIEEALKLGFNVHDDYQGQCHCRAGVWSIDGLKPAR